MCFSPMLLNSSALFHVSQVSPACPSDKSNIKTSIEHWFNDNDRGKPNYYRKIPSQYFVHQ
jgi:hypothetical protein